MNARWRWLLVALAVATVAGGAAVLARRHSVSAARADGPPTLDASMVASLLSANDSLRDEMERLDRQISDASSGSNVGRLETMAGTLNSLRIVNGAVAAVGPGVEVRIGGSFTAATIRDVVNELKSGGAEALSVNGRRLTLWSAIYQEQDEVLLDGYQLGTIVTIEAIGDSATLTEVLVRRGGLVSLLESEGVTVEVVGKDGVDEVRMPMAGQPPSFRYAHSP
jgi:uncharacterized protein YlxW (UPF0749 family)